MILSFLGTGFNLSREFDRLIPKDLLFGAISTRLAVANVLPGKSSFKILASVRFNIDGCSLLFELCLR